MASINGVRDNLELCFVFFVFFLSLASGQLSSTYYDSSCPKALSTIRSAVRAAVAKEHRMGASLLRLHFHDCFVNGCDGSVLLDDTASFTGEKTAGPNDSPCSQVESVCPQVVSCADILAVAARDSVVAVRERHSSSSARRTLRRSFDWESYSTTASLSNANNDLPAPTSDLSTLISAFAKKGLSSSDMVALSGSHTIGQARCTTFRNRVYDDSNINSSFATSKQSGCPRSGSDDQLSPLDTFTPSFFDGCYYKNLVDNKGLLHSDQELYNGGSTDSQVSNYVKNPAKFFTDFATAMVKMGRISPLLSPSGEVRVNCRKTN
ncbi:unnamed protein product [Spirodela intermedia]|uniref:Peroxidase n=1 Tax=Spirodela intermedia TaxID=51605 RepID=A0A7I8IGD6_SPIIN|nr:unnamed protein product [Spirodela intermedia]CAA6656939.1 unnamed protein product [Spirodela intermedia]